MGTLSVFDSESGAMQALPTCEGQPLLWYACGPTVYDEAHVGHARAYVAQDLMHRILTKVLRLPVTFVMGLTDVDDKIIARAGEVGVQPGTLARVYEGAFLADLAALNVLPPTTLTRVSEHIPAITQHISAIQAAGVAYSTPSGVYFGVGQFPGTYGKLSSGRAAQADGQEQGIVGAGAKRSAADFALWKASKEGEPAWPSPWGPGRPGWHIECSAMATAVLGDALHLHSGGVDLAFPHHCNEIAQAEAASLPAGASACCAPGTEHAALQGKKWVQAWLHCGHVHIHGRKMSKSLKNFVTVRSMLQQLGRDGADAFRWWCAERHYRSSATWDDAAMQAALSAVQRLAAWRQRVQVVCDEAEAGQVLPGAAISAWRSGNTSPAAEAHVQGISWGPHEQALLDTLHTAMAHAHASLAADFDTAHALRALQRVAAAADTYTSSGSHPNSMLLRQVIRTTQDLAEALGFTFLSATGAACAPAEPSDSPAPPNSAALVAAVREQVRALGLRQDMPPAAQEALLGLADTVRDALLPQLPGGAAFAVDSPTQRNAADRAWQVAIAEAAVSTPSGAKAASSGNSAPRGAREVPAWQRGSHWEDLSCPPSAVFADSSQYSAWDDQGVPTHDAEGAPLSKNGIKKRRKALDKYERAWKARHGSQ